MKAIVTYLHNHNRQEEMEIVSFKYTNGALILERETGPSKFNFDDPIEIEIVEDKEKIIREYFESLKGNRVIAKYIFNSILNS